MSNPSSTHTPKLRDPGRDCTCSSPQDMKAPEPTAGVVAPVIDIYADRPVVTLDYQIAVMQAAREGKKIEVCVRDSAFYCWTDSNWHNGMGPCWNWSAYAYRVSPAGRPKKLVPWTYSTIPLDRPLWLRPPDGGIIRLVTSIDSNWVMSAETSYNYETLFKSYSWSHTPCDFAGWHDTCGTEVVA